MKHFVYLAHCPELGLIKIGLSRTPRKRVKQLKPRTHLFALVSESELMESQAHAMFADKRAMGEWFNISRSEAVERLQAAGLNILIGSTLRQTKEEVRRCGSVSITPEMSDQFREIGKRTGLSPKEIAGALLRYGLGEVAAGRLTINPPRLIEAPKPQPEIASA